MLKRCIWLAVATVFFTFQIFVGNATAVELDRGLRTVPLNESGQTVVLSLQQVERGKRVFNDTCSKCHAGGVTKTDFNVSLSQEDLAFATPRRDTIEGLIDYMKNPTSYDGETDISELHPSIKSADIFAEMRNLTEDDLFAIAGHILIQPKIQGIQWGGGKAYR